MKEFKNIITVEIQVSEIAELLLSQIKEDFKHRENWLVETSLYTPLSPCLPY